jgi:hypothetical protein
VANTLAYFSKVAIMLKKKSFYEIVLQKSLEVEVKCDATQFSVPGKKLKDIYNYLSMNVQRSNYLANADICADA